jgi:E3 ubiquitin-protein ligase NRDP1
VIPKDEYKDHNCIRELRSLSQQQQQKLSELKTEITDQNLTINELKREMNLIKDFMRAMRVSNPAMRAIADQMERDEVLRWANTLPRARVTRWGGMISTPDDALQVKNIIILRWLNRTINLGSFLVDGEACPLRVRMSSSYS